jgi:predicted regulator of Ras-like GTPase activity (Roadblock/LC7/MglB family)/predicted Zn-dependent protease
MSGEDIRGMSEQLAADPGSLVFLPLAEALLARADLAHAARVARRGAERHAARADAHDLVARIALAQNDVTAAETAWQKALAIAPDSGAAHRGLGFLRYQQGRFDEAEQHLGVARAANPSDPALESAWDAVQAARAATGEMPTAPSRRASAPAPAPTTSASGAAGAAALFDIVLGETAQVALLLDADGLVVAGRYETADGTDLGAVIGAHLSGVSDEAARAMRHFGLGAWTRIALESEAASIAMAPAGDAITLVAAPTEVPLGFVRRTLEQCVAQAQRWLGGGA